MPTHFVLCSMAIRSGYDQGTIHSYFYGGKQTVYINSTCFVTSANDVGTEVMFLPVNVALSVVRAQHYAQSYGWNFMKLRKKFAYMVRNTPLTFGPNRSKSHKTRITFCNNSGTNRRTSVYLRFDTDIETSESAKVEVDPFSQYSDFHKFVFVFLGHWSVSGIDWRRFQVDRIKTTPLWELGVL